jgi:enoyl-[acyl-carrier protein] reductase I
MAKRVKPLAEQLGSSIVLECEVGSDASIDAAFAALAERWDRLDFLVHAIAFSDREELKGKYLDTSRRNFALTLDISCFSFTAVCQRAARMMPAGGSLITLTYYGAERVMPHYNVMGVAKAALEASVRYLAVDLGGKGIRVNAISAGPIKTLSGAGVGGFRKMLNYVAKVAPLRRNVSTEDVGNAATFLCSEMAAGVTGEIMYVDSGFSTVGMSFADEGDD